MALMTGNEYVESMRKLNLQVYMFGEKIGQPVDVPILRPSLNSVRAIVGDIPDRDYVCFFSKIKYLLCSRNGTKNSDYFIFGTIDGRLCIKAGDACWHGICYI